MGYYDNVYKKRLNRFGTDYQSRMQGEREHQFEVYKDRSVYKCEFEFNGIKTGTLEHYRQNETKTLQYLLTDVDVVIPEGTILDILDVNGVSNKWMVYWLENMKASGYNRYVVLKMTHYIKWISHKDKTRECEFWAYFYGQEDNMLKDELRSRSRSGVLYNENLKLYFFITPINTNIKKDDYFTIGEGILQEGYRVTGFDRQSSKGVEYVSVDPLPLQDITPPPEKTPSDKSEDFFWINGGDV